MEIGLTHTSTLTVENKHLAIQAGSGDLEVLATPVMMALMENAAVLTGIEGRKLTFKVIAEDETGTIGEGEHLRFIVDRKKFMAKLQG